MAIPEIIEQLAHQVRTEIYGRDVREALATSMEATAEVAEWSREVAQQIIDGSFDEGELNTEIERKLNELEQQYAPRLTSIETEIEDARGYKPNLGDRLNEFSSQLAENTQRIVNHKELKPMFVFIDDDARTGAYSILKQLFDSYGLKFTLSVITGRVGQQGVMTLNQLKEMHSEGYEIISHTHTHPRLTDISEYEINQELKNSYDWLVDNGMPSKHLAYPYGVTSDRVIKYVARYYDSAVVTNKGYNTRPLPTFGMWRLGIGAWGTTDFNEIKEYIDKCYDEKLICFITTHVDDNDDVESFKTLVSDTIDYIQNKGGEIVTYSEAFEHHRNTIEQGIMDYNTRTFPTVISADGEISGRSFAVVKGNLNQYTASTAVRDFPNETITINQVQDSYAQGLPNNQGGILFTHRIAGPGFWYQEYKDFRNNDIYTRRHNNSTNEWEEWEKINSPIKTILSQDSSELTRPWGSYPLGTITHTKIQDSHATGSPTGVGGILITYRMHGEASFAFQEFHVRRSTAVYKRYVDSSDNVSWADWVKISAD